MKCSVIVANYNNADVIATALQSIEAQSYPDWEAIIVDDASTDESVLAIESYLEDTPFRDSYKFIRLETNTGAGNAKRVAVEHATGELIIICDPDDALHPEALVKVAVGHQFNPNASIVYAPYFHCDSNLKPQGIRKNAGPVLYADLLENKVSALISFKKSLYLKTAGFDPYFRVASDKDLYYKLEEVGDIVYLDEPLYFYRIWQRGISQGFEGYVKSRDYKLMAIENAVKRREHSGIKKPTPAQLQHLLAEVHLLQAEGILYSDRKLDRKFFQHLIKAIKLKPFSNLGRKLKVILLLSRIKKIAMRKYKKGLQI